MLARFDEQALKSATIFAVDDQPANLKLIDRMLSTEGYTNIITIQHSKDVLELYLEHRPQLILLDINMPDLNGYDVMNQLKAIDADSVPPIVFVTAQDSREHRIRAFEDGALDFISKPFDRVELLARVRNLLALENAHQQLTTRNIDLEKRVELRTRELRETHFQIVQRLSRAAEYRDNDTGAHIVRMSRFSTLLARQLGMSDRECENILHASPMHDVGKIGIPDDILLKPGKLTPDEWEVMKTHSMLGYEILEGDESELLSMARDIALSHHEKWDGRGYPYGTQGEDIPLVGRIVALADVFDALTSERPYKKAWEIPKAVEFINDQSGAHFDPAVVSSFNKCLTEFIHVRDTYVDTYE